MGRWVGLAAGRPLQGGSWVGVASGTGGLSRQGGHGSCAVAQGELVIDCHFVSDCLGGMLAPCILRRAASSACSGMLNLLLSAGLVRCRWFNYSGMKVLYDAAEWEQLVNWTKRVRAGQA
jgi:hypothetical protein